MIAGVTERSFVLIQSTQISRLAAAGLHVLFFVVSFVVAVVEVAFLADNV